MDGKNWIMIVGIVAILLFLASYLESKSPLDIVGILGGILILIAGFYIEDKKINVSVSFVVATISINIFQWLILIYTFYYIPVHVTIVFYFYLIATLLITITLVNQIRKKNPKSLENSQITKINVLKDKTKLMLLVIGIIIVIGSLTGFIVYYAPIFIYGITLGLMVFIYGFYHEDKKVNVSVNYIVAMSSVFILQWIIIYYFWDQFAKDDLVVALALSIIITTQFLIQIFRRLKILPNKL